MEEQRQRQEEGTRTEGETPAGESEAQKPVAQPTGMYIYLPKWTLNIYQYQSRFCLESN